MKAVTFADLKTKRGGTEEVMHLTFEIKYERR